MQKPHDTKWLFLDLNSYFASVEQQENPALRGRPVAVVPMDTPHTCAIAASYEAKAYGVKTGTIIRDAKKMCPNLICVLARHDMYVGYHERIIEEVVKHTPINKIWSIDELSSRLPPNKRTPEKAAIIAENIKNGIHRNIGPAINCSIGIAPNSLLAKIATGMEKPDGLVILRQENLPGRLFDLQLTDLPGIGRNMRRRLNRAGISSIKDFWNTSPKHARKIWGSVEGERFWYWLHGYDFEREETNRSMIGHSRVLDPNLRSPEKTRLMARRLLTKATARLRRQNLYAGCLSLGVRTIDGQKWQRELRISPANDPFTLLEYLDRLWQEMSFEFRNYIGQLPRFKKVSTLLTSLRTADQITEDLFETREPENIIRRQKHEALAGALDKLQEKYKKETVTLGVPPKTLAGHVGTKIAFSRVPDKTEFWN